MRSFQFFTTFISIWLSCAVYAADSLPIKGHSPADVCSEQLTPVIGVEPSELELEQMAQQVQSIVDQASDSEIAQAQHLANELINTPKTRLIPSIPKIPKWIVRHVALNAIWIGALLGAYEASDFINELRANGLRNFFTYHYSNFVQGLAYIGAGNQYLRSIVFSGRPKVDANGSPIFSVDDTTKKRIMFFTAIAFTGMNGASELGGRPDVVDFASGEMALVVYYYFMKVLDRPSKLAPIQQ